VRGIIVRGWSASVRNRSFFKDLSSEKAFPASVWGKAGCVARPLHNQLCFRKVGFPDGCLTLLGPVPSVRPPHCQPQQLRRLSAEAVSKNIDAVYV
jgi:hypothetical protein